jgi:membrane protease subunit HflK
MHRAFEPHHEQRKRPVRWLALAPWAVLAYVATGFYSVQPNEQAVVRRCGRVLPHYRPPGLHFGFPYPIDRVDVVQVTKSKRVSIEMRARKPGADRPAPAAEDSAATGVGLLERALGRKIEPQQAECLTGDRNLIVASAIVQYRIKDAGKFLFNSVDAPALIGYVASSSLSSVISSMPVDDVLTLERIAIQNAVKEQTQDALDQRFDAGVLITSVSLEGVKAPDEVADAFRDVTAAREDCQRMINEAEGYANQLAPQTRGQAERIRLEAQGYAEQVVKQARGEADRFRKEVAQLKVGRELTVRRLIVETMEEVLPRLNKIILDGRDGTPIDLGLVEEKQ